MKYFIYNGLLLCAILLVSSCQNEFNTLNTNPNSLEKTEAGPLLTNIVLNAERTNTENAWLLGNGYGQYMTFSSSYYNLPTRYQPVSNDPVWNGNYNDARNALLLYNLGTTRANPTPQAIGLALQAYSFAQLTDMWGDIPFKNALQASSGTFTPSFDSQQTVYTDANAGVLALLRKADQLLATSTTTLTGDPLYNGDPKAWRRLVNALRVRYLLRISGKQDVSAELKQIVADGALMQSASQSAATAFQTAVPYVFPSISERSGDFSVKYLSNLFYTVLQSTGDATRLSLLAAPNSNGKNQTTFSFANYGGMPLVTDATASQVVNASNFSANFLSITNPALLKERIMTYAEQQFALAEAAQRGLIPGVAADYYTSGVRGAFAEWGLTDAQAQAYLQNPGVAFNSASAIEQIITQKWIANFNVGFEGWLEYLRTGYPALDAGGAVNLNGGTIPTRFLYPDPERTINSTNYNAEIQKMGGKESTTYRAWWAAK